MNLINKITIIVCCFVSSGVYAGFGDIFAKAVVSREGSAAQSVIPEKSDKELAQELVLDALENEKYDHAEALLRLHRSILVDGGEAVEKQCETLRDVYKDTLDAELSRQMLQRSFVPHDPSKSEPIEQNSFFNRVLSHITYGTHEKNQAVITASKNGAILSKIQLYLNGMRDACKTYQSLCGEAYQCPICLDSSGSMKKMIVCCDQDQNHVMCAPCFNNKDVHNCSMCRGEFKFGKMGMCLQCGTNKDLKFAHCKKCESTSVLCDTCTSLPCCTRHTAASQSDGAENIHNHVRGIIKTMQDRFETYKKEQHKKRDKELEVPTSQLKRMLEEAQALTGQIDSINKDLERTTLDRENDELQRKLHERRYLRAQIANVAQRLKRLKEQCDKIKSSYEDRINEHKETVDEKIDVVKKMAEESTGEKLEMPESDDMSGILQLLRDLVSEED